MRAMVLAAAGTPLRAADLPRPDAGPGQVLVRVRACGICRTDLHLRDGEVAVPHPPRVLGHQVVGTVEGTGERVGIPWMGWTCGRCAFCASGRENLCPRARFTGRDLDGGMAEYAVADRRWCFPIPEGPSDVEAAPLLCAGLIGFRALRMCGDAHRVGLYGFGAAAHIVAQVARHQGREVLAFTRPGDDAAQALARRLGAVWAGASGDPPPAPLDAAIIFAPLGALVPAALRAVDRGGTVVCAGIHMSPIPEFSYDLLWGERVVRSVANLTRADGDAFFRIAAEVPLEIAAEPMPLAQANEALERVRSGRVRGAAVLVI
jgi:alcohol dehydrogenase, propanol-preferring